MDLKLRLKEFAKIKSGRSTAKDLSDLACSTLVLRLFLAHFFLGAELAFRNQRATFTDRIEPFNFLLLIKSEKNLTKT